VPRQRLFLPEIGAYPFRGSRIAPNELCGTTYQKGTRNEHIARPIRQSNVKEAGHRDGTKVIYFDMDGKEDYATVDSSSE
jgi:hypothetical protein